jgi:hypothetical protein
MASKTRYNKAQCESSHWNVFRGLLRLGSLHWKFVGHPRHLGLLPLLLKWLHLFLGIWELVPTALVDFTPSFVFLSGWSKWEEEDQQLTSEECDALMDRIRAVVPEAAKPFFPAGSLQSIAFSEWPHCYSVGGTRCLLELGANGAEGAQGS